MHDELLVNKLKAYKKHIKHVRTHKKYSVEEIHALRVQSRELSSLININSPFYLQVKQVIKSSNKIRDIDVFLEVYLASLPKKHKSMLGLKKIRQSQQKKREKKIAKLHTYISSFHVPKSVPTDNLLSQSYPVMIMTTPPLKQKELHKYRISIKKRLYNEKNRLHADKEKVKTLTKIKDLLGTINDNYNGLKSLKPYAIQAELYDQIQDFTENKNMKLFQKFKEVEKTL